MIGFVFNWVFLETIFVVTINFKSMHHPFDLEGGKSLYRMAPFSQVHSGEKFISKDS